MNKKQKLLTVVALLVFIALGAFHYLTVTHFYYWSPNRGVPLLGISDPSHAIVSDVKTPWFMLGVIYAALFCKSRLASDSRPLRATSCKFTPSIRAGVFKKTSSALFDIRTRRLWRRVEILTAPFPCTGNGRRASGKLKTLGSSTRNVNGPQFDPGFK
jgi:hypothetical protein